MKQEPFLFQAIIVGLVIAFLLICMNGCASKKIMKNCEHQNAEFYSCEEP